MIVEPGVLAAPPIGEEFDVDAGNGTGSTQTDTIFPNEPMATASYTHVDISGQHTADLPARIGIQPNSSTFSLRRRS